MAAALGLSLPVVSLPVSVGTLVASNATLLYVLAILYLLAFAYALRRLALLPPTPQPPQQRQLPPPPAGGARAAAAAAAAAASPLALRLSSPRLFVIFVAFSSAVRAVSIAVCTLLTLDARLRARLTEAQLSLTVQLLFNAGDWQTVCCYALLMLVWLEMLQRTRAHVYDPRRITRDWRAVLCAVAAAVQLAQIGLYIACFETAPAVSQRVLTAIYITLAAFNIALPLLLCVGWGLAGCLYAGFPFRSAGAERAWRRFTPLVLFWTLGRALWSLGTLSLTNAAFLQALSTAQWSWSFPLAMLTLFVLAELVPFLASLGSDVLNALRDMLIVGGGRGAARGARGGRGALALPQPQLLLQGAGGGAEGLEEGLLLEEEGEGEEEGGAGEGSGEEGQEGGEAGLDAGAGAPALPALRASGAALGSSKWAAIAEEGEGEE